ncbi:major facilitator superfamily MFS_1 [Emticicia oligotrophica DSM 17448]|uniref:Major facilitator superfamily MFS_1 n=1 Tax=Emticicia oligotrophica (strain DSM 17448 / CIP 109782 / MTCC 6937 / GPTSA100-15) TaxID=929562 RepID=A0ABN4ADL2_EMTOG|nr:MFS transporter [Emticicia oligotrophica]AFK01504.1 major facilitator superfamily MFS_1 [Emticicia oligotrophica DSM 17448]
MQNNRSHLYTLMTVWFFWSFVAASNGILIPLFKEKFQLTQTQAQLVDFAFYAAYFIGSVLYLIFSRIMGGDILNKIGYKNGIVIGLLISAIGTLLFYPAAQNASYNLLLSGLFIVGLGFSLQQTATQPFMIALGPPETGAQRINLGGAVNNLGGTIGPALVSYAIFGSISKDAAANASIEDVKVPYLILGALFALMALFFWVSKLPRIKNDEDVQVSNIVIGLPMAFLVLCVGVAVAFSIEIAIVFTFILMCVLMVGYMGYSIVNKAGEIQNAGSVLSYPQAILGMTAIFVYVGVEVTIGSNLGEYLKETQNLDSSQISKYVSLFWGSMMIGRWTAAIGNFNPSASVKKILTVAIPFVAFAIVLIVNSLYSGDVSDLFPYAVCVAVMILAYFASQEKPVRLLLIFTALGAIMSVIGVMTSGKVALFALISGGLFCSVLWPSIFSLGTAGLGKFTNQGAAFLIMMILGGSIIPVVQGKVADSFGIQESYLLAAGCFIYLFIFGIVVQGVLRKQGIDFDKEVVKGGGKGH